jgi:hypothetical protein
VHSRQTTEMSFSRRSGHRPPPPQRVVRDQAPDRLRLTLLEILVNNNSAVEAYRQVSRTLGQLPDPQIWGDSYARPRLEEMIRDAHWYEVFDLLEEAADGRDVDAVNECLEACGLAYEMGNDSQIADWEPEARELQLQGVENDALTVLSGRFEPVRLQYERALTALTGRPSDPEVAVAEALNALEAVVTIVTGKTQLAAGLDALYAGSPPWTKALSSSLKSLHGYASQLPGARHGRHKHSDVEMEEARCVVRCAGAAIVMITSQRRARP